MDFDDLLSPFDEHNAHRLQPLLEVLAHESQSM